LCRFTTVQVHDGGAENAMVHMLCRNRVRDYAAWRRVFDSNEDAAREAGLHLRHVWRSIDDPDEVWFLFEAENRERAEAFVNDPAEAAVGEEAGVIDGDIRFLEPTQS
jgi:hypothetical protein